MACNDLWDNVQINGPVKFAKGKNGQRKASPEEFSVSRRLDQQKEQTKEKSQNFLSDVQEQIIQGKTLSEVLENSGHFSSYEFYSIKIGE